MANIKLNFLPLDNNSFDYTVYRKLPEEEEKLDKSEMRYPFVETDGNPTKVNYNISFKPKDGFVEHEVNSADFLGLTKKFLLLKLLETLDSTFCPYTYNHYKRFTEEQVEFIIEEFPEGNRVVFLTPYYLEEQKKFGFLIDFKFIKNESTQFNKQVQRLSLSLDDHYRSNKNYY